MSAESFKRKLTAILSADVKGYSRLMGQDDAETLKTLTAYRKIMGVLIQQHRGRVIDSPGDNILAGFASVVAAQNELKARKDGKATILDGDDADIGKSWIEEDMLCDQWDNLYESLKDCWVV